MTGVGSSRGLRGLLACALLLAVCLAGARLAQAGDPPYEPPVVPAGGPGSPGGMGAPVPVPPGGPGAPAPSEGAGADAKPPALAPAAEPTLTEEALFSLLKQHPIAFAALIVLRFGAAAGGLVVIILLLVRRGEVRRGLVAAPVPRPPAVAPFELGGALAMVGLWFVAGPLLSAVAAQLLGEPGGSPSLVTSLACMCVASLPIAIAIGLRARRLRAERGPPAIGAGDALRIAGGVFLVTGAVVLVLQLASALVIQHVFGRAPEMQDLVHRMVAPRTAVEPWLISFLGVVVAPFAEEAVFRGTLYPAVRRYLGAPAAALVVSAIFAAIHANALALVPLFGLALLLTWCYERTGSIFAGVVVHALSNAASLVPLLLAR